MKDWNRKLLIVIVLLFPVLFILLSYLEDVFEAGGIGGVISLVGNVPITIIDTVARFGYVGIFALMLLEAAAFPVPSEIILPLAGYLVSRGALEFWDVILYSTIASLLGSFVDYFLGWKLGRSLFLGPSKLPYLNVVHLQRAQTWFEKYGPAAVTLFRLVPTARVLISFPAGAYGMSKQKFAAYTLLGCLPWNIILVYLGWWLGASWGEVTATFRYVNIVAYAFIAIFVTWLAVQFTSRRKRNARNAQRRTQVISR